MKSHPPAPLEVRSVSVHPPDARVETGRVVQAAVVVAAAAILVAGLHPAGTAASAATYPYQVLYRDQPVEIRRVYSELMPAVDEAVYLRTPAGEWPGAKALADEFVAPFHTPAGRVRDWRCAQDGDLVNYFGAGEPSFLLMIQQNVPHPGGAGLDEFHRRMDDGSLIHVSVWMHDGPAAADRVLARPERRGWKQIVTGLVPAEGR